ncbi:UvrD-helicase domain-containing protein [Aminobacterium mobile]|uniref:UvrD-helicase domain-containing protein n=1 Tax=Aminobacterium mobile TaxID=81467 RepID=UPI0004634D75|nr:UvrD-helicase domain-containing protein [Aminobacterium mobile]
MTNITELQDLEHMPSAAIVAPAGHGKTEIIVDIVKRTRGRCLVLTHTNAGVEAVRKRMRKREIPNSKYKVLTIAGFCMYWCFAYPSTAHFTQIEEEPCDEDYKQLYAGAKIIFGKEWAQNVLSASYSKVIVDEYQDCLQIQHEIFTTISSFIPIIVLGDPMQAIFGWAGQLVDWKLIDFPIIELSTKPWRWEKSNPALGKWLTKVRSKMLSVLNGDTVTLNLRNIDNVVEIISKDALSWKKIWECTSPFNSVTFITQWLSQQVEFSRMTRGLFQNDEAQECRDLFEYAYSFDSLRGAELGYRVLAFLAQSATHVSSELSSYFKHLEKRDLDFSKIKKHKDLGFLITELCQKKSQDIIISIIEWFESQCKFYIYRKELIAEMKRGLRYSKIHNISVLKATEEIRRNPKLQRKYSKFRFLASRTVLSKGLEFECVLVDMRQPLCAKDFYVAITRATKMVYIITNNSNNISFRVH